MFDEDADRREEVVADDEVAFAFPMAELRAIRGGEWSVVDAEHRLLEAGPSALLSVVRSAVIPAGA